MDVPIIAAQVTPALQEPTGVITPTIDGLAGDSEWVAAGRYEARGGAQARAADVIAAFYYGYDVQNLYARVDAKQDWDELGDAVIGLYVGVPGMTSPIGMSRFGADSNRPTRS